MDVRESSAGRPSEGITRRGFVASATAISVAPLIHGATVEASQEAAVAAPVRRASAPFLTPAGDFENVSRGTPRPDTLTGQALVEAGLTPETWKLEITADTAVDPPHVKQAATIQRTATRAEGTALDLKALLRLGTEHEVRYIKAMQCLNIAAPLGQGLWEGVPLRDVLNEFCGTLSNVRRIYYWGFHNNDPAQIFQSSLSYTQVMETPPGELPAFLAYRLNGEPIAPERGGPVRMIVPWAHGFKSIKWIQHLFLTNDYRSNDTYALSNNDPESFLKTAAYVDQGPAQIPAGRDVVLTGSVISGPSGLERVEYWVRKVDPPRPPQGGDASDNSSALEDQDPELLRGPWLTCALDDPPDWEFTLPADCRPASLLGFDPETGRPLSWPPRYGMTTYHAVIRGLTAGHYEIRARAVDLNGFAQPLPRPQPKSGRNSIQVWAVEVV